MVSNFIMTVYGADIPGILKSLARMTRDYEGSWLTSKVIKLDSQFAAIMSVIVSDDQESMLKAALEKAFPSINFIYTPAKVLCQEPLKTINLVVDCIDRPGLTGDLSNILANLDLDVENMECKRMVMDGIGETVFSAQLTLAVPEGVDSEIIAGEIETLSEDVKVNVL
ncbi:glycine cleavage system protein R [Desulforhopalus singaporensis]|uniref:Glycine cleavage system regulatory protein n=1 Tax=Desulforhopalus singaporensis TaxID=91360 RepID=A0A1H0RUI2_9BACT|nr:ACT domain-containing protein [Desulforhopalus singaporensis]SDP33055.1 Glycine cleavage system regulatory protein [Desulforhopalus singaporensis]